MILDMLEERMETLQLVATAVILLGVLGLVALAHERLELSSRVRVTQ